MLNKPSVNTCATKTYVYITARNASSFNYIGGLLQSMYEHVAILL